MILTQNSLVLHTGELDAIETDTYKDRPEAVLCGSSMCRAKTSITKIDNSVDFKEDKINFDNTINQKLKSEPLTGADMPQFSHFDRETLLKELGKKKYSMSKRTKTKIRQKLTAWANVQRKTDIKFVFLTLTLTSKQRGTDKDYSKMLNIFFNYMRKYYGFKNYLYVNERQTKNTNNIHSHIVTDQYLPVKAVNRIWCKILSDHGYTFKGEAILQPGKPLPNPVDITCIYNINRVSSYITKYITKNDSEFDCLIWNCSNSISKLFTSVKIWDKETFSVLFEHVRTVLNAKLSNGDTLHIHLLSLYHGIQKKHFKINESVLSGTIDREKYIKKIQQQCKLNQQVQA